MSRGRLRSPRKFRWYSLDEPPSLAELRRIARAQGYTLRLAPARRFTVTNNSGKKSVRSGSTRSPHYWLLDCDAVTVLTPRLTLDQVWLAVALPSVDPRVEGLWLSDQDGKENS